MTGDLFDELEVWEDFEPRRGDDQMARDEALLTSGLKTAILRIYRWKGTWASFGWSQSVGLAIREAPGFSLVRRWTGGGVVRHDHDLTFSLLVPASQKFSRLRPREAYAGIHEAIRRALVGHMPEVRLASECECRVSAACFQGPSLYDLLDVTGRKICGGAQRRTREGVLHQGSLQVPRELVGFGRHLAGCLSARVLDYDPKNFPGERSEILRQTRYGLRTWTERIP